MNHFALLETEKQEAFSKIEWSVSFQGIGFYIKV